MYLLYTLLEYQGNTLKVLSDFWGPLLYAGYLPDLGSASGIFNPGFVLFHDSYPRVFFILRAMITAIQDTSSL